MIGIIGGSGVYEITEKADNCEKKIVKTDYGEVEVSILDIFSKNVAFIPRHASGHSIPPHKINFRANIDALKNVGVTKIIATNSVGSMNLEMPPGSFVIPDDFLDFSQDRKKTFYEDKVVHIDVTEAYCPQLRDPWRNICLHRRAKIRDPRRDKNVQDARRRPCGNDRCSGSHTGS